MSTKKNQQSLENLSKDLYYILVKKNQKKIQLYSLLDMLLFFILSTLIDVFLLPVGLCNLIVIYGTRRQNTNFLNMGFIIAFSSIPFKIILTIYRKTDINIFFCLLNCLSSLGVMVYTCKGLNLITKKAIEVELTVTQQTINPYLLKNKVDISNNYLEPISNSSGNAIMEEDL